MTDDMRRLRVIEVLELHATLGAQRDYERAVPITKVPDEVICGWEELRGGLDFERLWRREEAAALRAFDRVVAEVSAETPERRGRVEDVAGTAPWRGVMAAAAEALEVLSLRGRFDGATDGRS